MLHQWAWCVGASTFTTSDNFPVQTVIHFYLSLPQTVGHVLFSSVFTAYIVFAVVLYEEPTLVERLGPSYVEYMKRTPRFIPNFPTFSLKQHASKD